MEGQEKKFFLEESIAKNLPTMVKNELSKMSPEKQEEFLEEYKRKAKSLGPTYLLFFLLWMHYGYLKKWGLQIAFWLTLGGFLVWYIIDIFRIPNLVKDYNKDIATEIMRNLKIMSS